MKTRLAPIRCDECGRFISYADLESGKAWRTMSTPDSDWSAESYESLCRKCNNQQG